MKKTNNSAIKWLTSAHLVTDTYSGFLSPIMPFIAAKLGISMGIATVVMSIARICASLLQPIFGFFADSIFKRGFIFWGLMSASIFIPLCAIAPNLLWLTVFIIIGSLSTSIFHPQAIGFIIRFTEKDFSKNMAIFLSAGSIGYAFGPVISSAILQWSDIDKIPMTSFIGIILAISMFLFVPKISHIDKKIIEKRNIIEIFSTILKNNQIKILLVISVMKALISSSFTMLLPFLWKENHHSAIYIGLALFLFMVLGGLASFVSPHLEKIFGEKKVLIASLILVLPLIIIFVKISNNEVLSMIIFSIIAFVIMLGTPLIMVLAQRNLPQYKSIIGGFINGFGWGIVGIMMSGIGFLAEIFGILNVLMFLSLLPLICAYFVKYLKVEID